MEIEHKKVVSYLNIPADKYFYVLSNTVQEIMSCIFRSGSNPIHLYLDFILECSLIEIRYTFLMCLRRPLST